MKKLFIYSTAVFAVVLVLSTCIYSEPAGGGNRPMRNSRSFDGKGFAIISEKLNLTPEQKNKIENLRTAHQKKMIDLRADLQKARVDANVIRNSDNISRTEVVNSVEKINKIENEISLSRANHRMDIYELLTPEQKKIWKDLCDDMPMHKMGKGKGFRNLCR